MISVFYEYFKDSEATGIELLFLAQSGQSRCQRNPPIDLGLIFNQLIHLTWHHCSKVSHLAAKTRPRTWLGPPPSTYQVAHALSLTESWFPLSAINSLDSCCIFFIDHVVCRSPVATLPSFPYDQHFIYHICWKNRLWTSTATGS